MEWVISGAVLTWACWHWFIRNWVRKRGIDTAVNEVKQGLVRRAKSASIPEEELYAQVYEEVSRNEIQSGVWARAWSEAEGDERRAKARYLKLRVDYLRRGVSITSPGEFSRGEMTAQTNVTLTCPNCQNSFSSPAGRDLVATCPNCAARLRASTTHPQTVELIGPLSSQQFGRIGRLRCAVLFFALTMASVIILTIIKENAAGGGSISDLWLVAITIGLSYAQSAIFAARLHDLGASGWWALIGLVPFINLLMLVYFVVVEGDSGPNRFGDPGLGLFSGK